MRREDAVELEIEFAATVFKRTTNIHCCENLYLKKKKKLPTEFMMVCLSQVRFQKLTFKNHYIIHTI